MASSRNADNVLGKGLGCLGSNLKTLTIEFNEEFDYGITNDSGYYPFDGEIEELREASEYSLGSNSRFKLKSDPPCLRKYECLKVHGPVAMKGWEAAGVSSEVLGEVREAIQVEESSETNP